jgi:hypothetical protein
MPVKEFAILVREYRELEKQPSTPETKKRMQEINDKLDKDYYGEEYNGQS